MENIKDLIQNSCGLLRKTSIDGRSFKRPHYPTVVIYYGEKTARFHRKMKNDMVNGWGNNADYIRYYVMKEPDRALNDVDSGEEVTEANAGQKLTELYREGDIAADKNRIALYCYIDTSDIKSEGDFKKWYKSINHIKRMFKGAVFLSMLVVILNQSFQLEKESKMIKTELLEIYQNGDGEYGATNSHSYSSVYVISNRQKNNDIRIMDPDSDDYMNCYLLSDLILLANTDDDEYAYRVRVLYNNQCPAFTAAYGHKDKPVREITVVIMKVMLKKLEKLFERYSLQDDGKELKDALEIKGGTTNLIEEIYNEIKDGMPSGEFKKWLPMRADRRDISYYRASYGDADDASCGCLSLYVERNQLAYVGAELAKRDYIDAQIEEILSGKLNAAYYQSGVKVSTMDSVLSAIDKDAPYADKSIDAAIDILVQKRLAELMKMKYETAVKTIVDLANETTSVFNGIKRDFDETAAVGNNGTNENLENTYRDIAERFFNDENRMRNLFKRILRIGNGKSTMLDILLSELEVLSGSNPIFKAPFVNELSYRLEKANNASSMKAAQLIKEELIGDMNDKIRLHSEHKFGDRIYEVYLININDNSIRESLGITGSKGGSNKTYYNTMNNNMAESIWLYRCEEENLSM